jgi:DNA-binding XRE family transcriptional regulator
MLGEKIAQVAVGFGADDLDGTVVHELIYHDAGAKTPEGLTVPQLHRLIREAGRVPIERDTLYRRIIRDGAKWHVGESVRIVRELQELSQNQLARLTGIPQATISAIENDRVRLGVERAKVLARALKCHPGVLVFPGCSDEEAA